MSGPSRRLRVLLVLLLVPTGLTGAWALFGPASWYDNYGPPDATPSAFGAYNEHFVQDVGGGFLGIAAVLLFAAISMHRDVVRAALLGFLVFNVPHQIVHLISRGDLDTSGYAFVNASLALGIVVALWAWKLTLRQPGSPT